MSKRIKKFIVFLLKTIFLGLSTALFIFVAENIDGGWITGIIIALFWIWTFEPIIYTVDSWFS